MATITGSKTFSKLFILIFFLILPIVDGFFLQQTLRSNCLTYAVDEELVHAAACGETSNTDAIMSAAAAITKESCQLLGVKSVGVDYGLVRTGVAVTIGYDPKPLRILKDLNNTEVSQQVIEICSAEKANQVIVGLPLHKNGTEANQTKITRAFASELANHVIRNLGRS